MNKAKLVELADEVLNEIEEASKESLRRELEENICDALSRRFLHAYYYSRDTSKEGSSRKYYAYAYDSVKPILDDSINKLLGETK